MNEHLRAIVGARISEFQKKMADVKRTVNSLPNRTKVKITVVTKEAENRINKFQSKMGKLANSINAFGTVGGNMASGGLLAISPGVIPILATAGGLAGALASSLLLAGGAAVAFGAVAIPTISKLFDETAKLNSAQEAAKGEFTAFQTSWKGIVKDLENPVLQAFSTSMQVANEMLKMARPLFEGAATAVNNLLNSLKASLGTPPVQAFFDYMNKSGGPMLETLGKVFGNFMQGFMSMMVAFGPLAEQVANGLLNMSTKFAEWAAGLSKSEKFQAFISYVQENAPKVGTLIGNIVDTLVNLGIAMAPIGSKILDMVNKVLSWSNSMMQAHPWIGKLAAGALMLVGGLIALSPAFILVNSLFSGLSGAILKLAGNFMMGALRIAASWIVAMGPVGWVIAIVVGLVALIIANWDTVKAWTIKTWNTISTATKAAATLVSNWVKDKFNEIKQNVQSKMDEIKNKIQTAWDYIKNRFALTILSIVQTVREKFDAIKNAVQEKMNAVKDKVQDGIDKVKSFLSGIDLSSMGKDMIQGLINGIKGMAGNLVSAATGVVDGAVNAAKSLLGIASPSKLFFSFGKFVDMGLINGINSMTRQVSSAASNLAGVVADSFSPKVGFEGINSKTVNTFEHESNGQGKQVNVTVNGSNVNIDERRLVNLLQRTEALYG